MQPRWLYNSATSLRMNNDPCDMTDGVHFTRIKHKLAKPFTEGIGISGGPSR